MIVSSHCTWSRADQKTIETLACFGVKKKGLNFERIPRKERIKKGETRETLNQREATKPGDPTGFGFVSTEKNYHVCTMAWVHGVRWGYHKSLSRPQYSRSILSRPSQSSSGHPGGKLEYLGMVYWPAQDCSFSQSRLHIP